MAGRILLHVGVRRHMTNVSGSQRLPLELRFFRRSKSYAGMEAHGRLICTSQGFLQRQKLNKAKDGKWVAVNWMTVLFTVSAGGIGILVMKHFKFKKEEAIDMESISSYGRPALGGDFELVDQNSKPCSNRDFLGQWVLIYFGFTHCPDICPEELEKMGNVVDTIHRNSLLPDLQPVFISIDPDRDSPSAVKKYLSDFHPNLIGLSGDRDQVETASRAFRVYYSAGPKDVDDDYIVDHTVIMYLLNPDGDFCEYFGQNKSAGEIASSITSLMAKYHLKGK